MAMAQQSREPVVLEDASLLFKTAIGGVEKEHRIDLLTLKLVCDECQEDHQLPVKDGRYVPRSQFLLDLAGRLQLIGVEGCTPSIASQLWVAAYEGIESLKKNVKETPNSPSGLELTQEASLQLSGSDS
jgi:hypothetical protein